MYYTASSLFVIWFGESAVNLFCDPIWEAKVVCYLVLGECCYHYATIESMKPDIVCQGSARVVSVILSCIEGHSSSNLFGQRWVVSAFDSI